MNRSSRIDSAFSGHLATISALLAAGLLLLAVTLPRPVGAADLDSRLTEAEALIESGDAVGALKILNRAIARNPGSSQAHLLRSTAYFMSGEIGNGKQDLDRALELDPQLRQGWLNRAGVDMAEGNYDRALEALLQAESLDPTAPDNHLNIGTVRLLTGDRPRAEERFNRYLQLSRNAPEAIYLVATNYALAGLGTPAIGYLRHAIARDEKTRRRARTDPNFADLELDPDYQALLATDTYRLPADAHILNHVFQTPFTGADSQVLAAVIDAIQYSGLPLDPLVEVTPGWALVWGEARIKVMRREDGGSGLRMSAPADQFTAEEWNRWSGDLLRLITVRLTTRAN